MAETLPKVDPPKSDPKSDPKAVVTALTLPVGITAATVHLQGGPLLVMTHGGEVKAYPKDVIATIAAEAVVLTEDQYVALGGDYDTIEDFSEAVAILKHARDGGMTREEAEAWYTENKPPEGAAFDAKMWDDVSHPVLSIEPLRERELRPASELAPEITRVKLTEEELAEIETKRKDDEARAKKLVEAKPKPTQPIVEPPKPTQLPAK